MHGMRRGYGHVPLTNDRSASCPPVQAGLLPAMTHCTSCQAVAAASPCLVRPLHHPAIRAVCILQAVAVGHFRLQLQIGDDRCFELCCLALQPRRARCTAATTAHAHSIGPPS